MAIPAQQLARTLGGSTSAAPPANLSWPYPGLPSYQMLAELDKQSPPKGDAAGIPQRFQEGGVATDENYNPVWMPVRAGTTGNEAMALDNMFQRGGVADDIDTSNWPQLNEIQMNRQPVPPQQQQLIYQRLMQALRPQIPTYATQEIYPRAEQVYPRAQLVQLPRNYTVPREPTEWAKLKNENPPFLVGRTGGIQFLNPYPQRTLNEPMYRAPEDIYPRTNPELSDLEPYAEEWRLRNTEQGVPGIVTRDIPQNVDPGIVVDPRELMRRQNELRPMKHFVPEGSEEFQEGGVATPYSGVTLDPKTGLPSFGGGKQAPKQQPSPVAGEPARGAQPQQRKKFEFGPADYFYTPEMIRKAMEAQKSQGMKNGGTIKGFLQHLASGGIVKTPDDLIMATLGYKYGLSAKDAGKGLKNSANLLPP